MIAVKNAVIDMAINIQINTLNSSKYEIINSIMKASAIAVTATIKSVSLKYLFSLYLFVINKVAGIKINNEKYALWNTHKNIKNKIIQKNEATLR